MYSRLRWFTLKRSKSGISSNHKQLAQKATYKLTISKDLMAKSGDTLGKEQTISFTTRDTSVDTKVNMGMMAVMMIGMVVFTSRSAKAMRKKNTSSKARKTS